MLRIPILKAAELKLKMDALVSDLAHALDESQLLQFHQKRRGLKRRVKLRSNIANTFCTQIQSDDSSSVDELPLSQEKSTLQLTDSDELTYPDLKIVGPHLHHVLPTPVESDSVNESFQPVRLHSRSFGEIGVGKRKPGHEKSMEWDESNHPCTQSGACSNMKVSSPAVSNISNTDFMELDYSNESNISSSESDAGIYTCDEGREADDEQSDWFAEPGAVYGTPGVESDRTAWWNEDNISLLPSAKIIFKEKYERMTQESQQACRIRFQKLRERLLRREIRSGRRRLQDRRPGFSILSSVNDKVSQFLQNPIQSELHLKPMTETDRDQLKHLATLYSLNVISGDDKSAPILTKTRNTITARHLDVAQPTNDGKFPVPLNDLKRCRRTPPLYINPMTEGSNDSMPSIIARGSIDSIDHIGANAGGSCRPPVPAVLWGDGDIGDCCADSLSERLADSETDTLPSPTFLRLHDCTL